MAVTAPRRVTPQVGRLLSHPVGVAAVCALVFALLFKLIA